jgi:DNA polymerase I-like protein with 3'-5' exonuclease and polymerase domains
VSVKPIVVDFETDGIEARPKYPPVPRGVAIWVPGRKPQYLAWGHPTANNCTKEKAQAILQDIWKGTRELLFFHAMFDLDVAETHMGCKLPPWHRVHDALFSLFLKYPHSPSLQLKPASEMILGMKPEEQDAVRNWLVDHGVITKTQNHGPFICQAPGDVVGRYAIGDLTRTAGLHEKCWGELDAGERVAYDRERKLLPILLRNAREGMRFDVDRAEKDMPAYEAAVVRADDWLRKRLAAPSLNIDSDKDLGQALDEMKIVTEWNYTPKTKERSTSKKFMTIDRFHDKDVFHVLAYRNKLSTALSLNLRDWSAAARAANGRIFTDWRQVRSGRGAEIDGARTGRLTCSKFANVPKDFEDKNDGYLHPTVIKVPELPLVRRYILADYRQRWGHLDWSQQEFRLMGHYAEGEVLAAYQADPRTDFHVLMDKRLQTEAGLALQRRQVKIVNFMLKYGAGAGRLAAELRIPVMEAKSIAAGVKAATPAIVALDQELKERANRGEPVRTWGGRRYYVEAPHFVEKYGRVMDFGYKMLSYLIQGSGADMMKEALIRYDDIKKDGRMVVTVYDEANISAPAKALKAECALLRQAMESMECDVPMLTDTEVGPSWGELEAA